MTVPRFTPASADRLERLIDLADAAVDGGVAPDHAIAKAARDVGLPVGHVKLAVQAFNTGRALRQLGSSSDPWEKAAAYPQASASAVTALLIARPEKQAAAPDLTDYVLPPDYRPTAPPTVKAARAAVPAEKVADAPQPRDTSLGALFTAAGAVDAVTAFALTAAPGEYAAVKAAAVAAHPEAAAAVFGWIERDHRRVAAKAAAAPDPAVRVRNHPVVQEIGVVADVKAAAVIVDPDPEPPVGWNRIPNTPGWATKGAHNALLGLPVPLPHPVSPPPAAGPAPLLTSGPVRPDPEKVAGFGSAFRSTLSPVTGLGSNTLMGDVIKTWPGGGTSTGRMSATQSSALTAGLQQVDDQAALQEILADERFRTADPKLVVQTFRQLHGLAPRAIQNPAVAADFIHRRIQTGPLSAYDMKTLVDMEKGLAQISQPGRGMRSDDDES